MTDARMLLGRTEADAVQILAEQAESWVLRRCRPRRPRPADCVERVVRARRLDDGTVEVALSGFCDYPRGKDKPEDEPAGGS